MSRSFLIVLPKLMRSGVAPAASACSISTTEAVSKQEPSSASRCEDARIRIGLHRVEDARVRHRPGEGDVIFAHDVEVERRGTARLRGGCGEIPEYDRSSRHPFEGRGSPAPKRTSFGVKGDAERSARAVETRPIQLTRQSRPAASPRDNASTERIRSDAAPLDMLTPDKAQLRRPECSWPSLGVGNSPPHARQDRQASSVSQLWRLAETKKPGPSLL